MLTHLPSTSLLSTCNLPRSYHGGQLLCPLERTEQVRWSTNPRWEEWLQFDILTSNLPRVGGIQQRIIRNSREAVPRPNALFGSL